MTKKILIPVDLSIDSLNTLHHALIENKDEQVDVLLMYSEYLGSSITELLFYSANSRIQNLADKEFTDAMNIIRNKFKSTVRSMQIELFHGSSVQAWLNFYNANSVDMVYLPKSYKLDPKGRGFDPSYLIRASEVGYRELGSELDHGYPNHLYHLFQ